MITPLERQFLVIRAVLTAEVPESLSEIAERTGIPMSSLHRLVVRLCEQQILRRSPWRTYIPGAALRELIHLGGTWAAPLTAGGGRSSRSTAPPRPGFA